MAPSVPGRREAYATVLHSSDKYVCGAIILAQSIRRSGSTRDLVLLHDESIPDDKLKALATMGWILRKITRIRNPLGIPGSYNEYNYSKLRLWQLTEYAKIVYIDCDVLVLFNLDILFSVPQMSAANNHIFLFDAGVMVIEPSNCTFNVLMQNHDNVTSYNGGDQGFLNENFVSWHRIPRRMNYLKYFHKSITEEQRKFKEDLFAAEPPKLYSIHYLGRKPWSCDRSYDCNKDKEYMRPFVSDVAHRKWWNFYDELDESMQVYCKLPEMRNIKLS
jgi:xylan alpha-glucuronosyltransferase